MKLLQSKKIYIFLVFFSVFLFGVFLFGGRKRVFAQSCPANCTRNFGHHECGVSSIGGCQQLADENHYVWVDQKTAADSECNFCNGQACYWIEWHTNCGGCCWSDAPPPSCWPYPCPTPTATPTPLPTLTPTPTPIPRIEVSGTVYDDPTGRAGYAGAKCIYPGGGAAPLKPGGGSKVSVSPDGREGPVQGNGSYVVNQVLETGAKTIAISGMDLGYVCTCPNGCQYNWATVSGGNNTGWDFYVSKILARWAQVVGGHAHGQTGARVEVPAGNYFMIPASFSNNPGAATKTTGNITTIPGLLSTTNWKLTDALAQTSWRYSYHRLWVRAGSPTTPLPADGNKPGAGFYKKEGDLTIDGGWTGISGKTVIFVNGDVDIRTKITLANDSDFFAVIASGDISVDSSVGHAVKTNPGTGDADLTGVFLAEKNWYGCPAGCSTTKQLVIYGTIAADFDLSGDGSVKFNRDLGTGNNIGPGVSVIWNPNLLLNWPDQLSDALTDWREVAP